ncbi:hypothetical protein LTS17_007371 [Exophiala oligosperma]
MDSPKLKNKLFINNEYIPPKSGHFLTLRNPRDDSILSEQIPIAGKEDVDNAVVVAQTAFKTTWGRLPGVERAKVLLKFADILEENIPLLARLEMLAMGQPIGVAMELAKLGPPVFRYYAGYCDKIYGQMLPEDGNGEYSLVQYQPMGVCAGIAAWNATMIFFAHKVAPALAAGNTFIFKPSEKSPLASLALGDLITSAGFPPGTINIITGGGETGALLASHMNIRKISFTGSSAAGRKVQQAATASNLKSVTLELGGKSPSIIFDDADMENAVHHSSASFLLNSGQVCVAASRLLVHRKIAESFMDQLKARFEELAGAMGDPESPESYLGPLADRAQTERVLGYFEQARKDGVRFMTGGCKHERGGNYIQPTIMVDGSPDSVTWTEEIFGPALSIRIFDTEDEAIQLANDTSYGLSACVYTSDIARALRVTSLIEAGNIAVNSNYLPGHTVPFGGWKESGNGSREAGLAGLKSFMETKSVLINMKVGPRL